MSSVSTEAAVRPVLAARQVCKRFGAQKALHGAEFEVLPGEIKGLVGANGAGKSTLLKIVAGAMAPDSGEILVRGTPLHSTSMQSALQAGIALVAQELSLFPALSVLENFWIQQPGRSREQVASSCRQHLAGLGLAVTPDRIVGSLTLGEQQLVEIGRALSMEPQVLILDEPTSSLQHHEVERLHGVLRQLRARGTGIVYVSHFLEELIEICDSLAILRDGKTVQADFRPTAEGVSQVVAHMLGDRTPPPGSRGRGRVAATVLPAARSLKVSGLRDGEGLEVDRFVAQGGEVVGVTGLAGAGAERFFELLFGVRRPVGGTVELPHGREGARSIRDAVNKKVAFIPSDRKRLGLVLQQSIADNVAAVRSLVMGVEGFVLQPARAASRARHRCLELAVKSASVHQAVGELSGGNQQKVVFAKWLEAEPDLLLLDDPTRGVDIGAKHEVYGIVRRLADEGRVVLMNSSDPAELIEVCDRIVVFCRGMIIASLPAAGLTEHRLLEAMNGVLEAA